MHHLGPLPLTFEGGEQGFGGKNCQNGSRGNLVTGVKAITVLYLLVFSGGTSYLLQATCTRDRVSNGTFWTSCNLCNIPQLRNNKP